MVPSADTKITDLSAITGANTATGDLFPIVDVSDTTMAASGTDKKITRAELLNAFATAAAQTILDDADVGAIRTTLGVGTGDSPQLNAVNVGAATDTTLSRKSAGVLQVEALELLSSATGQPLDATLTALAGLTIADAKGIHGTGADAFATHDLIYGAWTAFTPTLSAGWALGNSTYVATYARVGRMIHFGVVITIGTTATKGTGMTAALPVTAADSTAAAAGITGLFLDSGTAYVACQVRERSTTAVDLMGLKVDVTWAVGGGDVTSTVPFTWATGDKIYYGGTYEAAS